MSSSNRKKKKRNRIIRLSLGAVLTIAALVIFITAVENLLSFGLNRMTGFYGIFIMFSLFVAGYIISPELKDIQKGNTCKYCEKKK